MDATDLLFLRRAHVRFGTFKPSRIKLALHRLYRWVMGIVGLLIGLLSTNLWLDGSVLGSFIY